MSTRIVRRTVLSGVIMTAVMRWADGDELCCMAEIDFALGARWFAKEFRRAFGKPREPALVQRGA